MAVAEEGGDDDVECGGVEGFVGAGEPEIVGYCYALMLVER